MHDFKVQIYCTPPAKVLILPLLYTASKKVQKGKPCLC